MLEYVNIKASTNSYMVKLPKGGFQSKEQVIKAFDRVYTDSLEKPREPHYTFLHYGDEVTQLLVTDWVLRPEYADHYRKLSGNVPGEEKDRMMASLVLHLHPELKNQFPNLDTADLSPETVFGIPMPETPAQSQMRVLGRVYPDIRLTESDLGFSEAGKGLQA